MQNVTVALASASLLTGVLLLVMAVRVGRRGHGIAGGVTGLMAAILFALAVFIALIGTNLATYHRLTYEQPVLEMTFDRIGERWFAAELRYADGSVQRVELRGDEGQIDARVLRWKAWVQLIGFDTLYRIERMSGRYRDLESERTAERSVHALHPTDRIDAWELARRFQARAPWIEAYYGSAVYVPMADRASYELRMSPSGLTARPRNDAARNALGQWK